MNCLTSLVTAVPTTVESYFMVIIGLGISIYGLKARTFREDGRLHMLTPAEKLEQYEPRWYHRLFILWPVPF